jgi:hypothetical protein
VGVRGAVRENPISAGLQISLAVLFIASEVYAVLQSRWHPCRMCIDDPTIPYLFLAYIGFIPLVALIGFFADRAWHRMRFGTWMLPHEQRPSRPDLP